jgi:hypothetical protein
MTLRLFEITQQLRELEILADSEDIPEDVLRDTIEGLTGDFETKAVATAKFILSLEATAEAIKAAADAMAIRAKRVQKRADAVRHYLLLQFQMIDHRKLDTPELVIARRANPVAVQVSDEAAIPRDYFVQPPPPPPKLDKKAVKDALQAGATVPGAYLESGEHLRITL